MTSLRVPVPPPIAGVIVPMVTPMLPSGAPDLESLDALVDHLIGRGVTGLLVLGSCGENGALSRDERLEVAARAVARVDERTHLMVGVPALGTREAVADAKVYAQMGADSLLVPPTFVFPHSAAELGGHFRAVAAAAGPVPVLAYNIPSRVTVVLEPDLMRELAGEGVVAGVKDSSGNVEAQRMLAEATADIEGFRRYTGSEFAIDGLLLGGFHGAVPGLANVFAPWHVELAARATAGDWKGAAEMQGRIVAFFKLYQHPMPGGSFSASVIASLKEALVQQGVIAHSTTAFPFVQVDDDMRNHVRETLATAEIGRP
ncbi:dihydrodipicolinate synthase family protein [Dactylosporangium sp. NBC_01737]|uniref:dihydrodipicolinate synthase family protein n=1 Tax=Dactylosporangium sp. NBC_01737 TaxID=2975959 RepID=UPI002E14407D|nr:dihydrodipicolinate synthase family protein [Dactylosporangium sp. NBC_01737]